ncbi:HAD family hydrolase [Derxia lacustris]|uniref:HAD family hydrolase n=1 Tax=Derxia lacustris TaxID=764842 RepID=UPI000A17685E|nr:HAD family phosphatase [Derxia lacustris]
MKLALFDLDHTLIPYDSGASWLDFLIARGAVPALFAERYLGFCHDYVASKVDLRDLNREYFALLRGHPVSVLRGWRDEWRDGVRPAIAAESHALVQQHRQAGDLCCLVTATSGFIAEAFRDIFGFEHLVATELVIAGTDDAARITGEVAGTLNYRDGKIVNVGAWLAKLGHDWSSFDATVFYSDSANDLPLLRHVTHPVAVMPDARLRAVALEQGWPIIESDRPASAA